MTGIEYMNSVCPTTKKGRDPNREDVADAFEDGIAEGFSQCKKQFIEKACAWLKENKDKYLYNTGEKGEYIPTCSGKMIDEFINYMKGK